MKTTQVRPADIKRSVIAVPPLARTSDHKIASEENRRLIRFLEAGGVTSILYGGNANLYNIGIAEYKRLVEELPEWASKDTWMIPSIGPAYGQMLDQADILREYEYPTAMVLPLATPRTADGVASGIRRAVDRLGTPIILYLKDEGYLPVRQVRELVDDGLVAAIKYAIPRPNPSEDEYLQGLVEVVNPDLIISGIGERPAIVHLEQFGLPVFTSGSVCLAPRQATKLLQALRDGRIDEARSIRQRFMPLEDLRDGINPIRVLHDAVTVAKIAQMGPILPLLSNLNDLEKEAVAAAARDLLSREGLPLVN